MALFLGGADEDRVAAEERGEHGGGEADVVTRHLFADAVGVERVAVHAAVRLGHEHELDTELLRVAHRSHDVLGTDVVAVEVELALRGEVVIDEVAQSAEHHLERVGVEAHSPDVADGAGSVDGGGHRWILDRTRP